MSEANGQARQDAELRGQDAGPDAPRSRPEEEAKVLEEQQEAAGSGEPAASEPEELEVKLEPDPLAEAEARAQEYLDLARRKQAEFENFRKRMSGQAAQAEERGVAKLAKELFTPLDHLGLAIKHAEDAAPLEALREEFLTALGRAGVEAFAPLGEVFDPTLHEAMAHAPIEGHESGTVAEVYQAGYRLASGTVIRPARVVVAQ